MASSLVKQPQGSVRSDDSPPPALKDPDQAYRFLHQIGAEHGGGESTAGLTALRRRIDWHIVPLMFCCYTMQFIDKVLLNVREASAILLQWDQRAIHIEDEAETLTHSMLQ